MTSTPASPSGVGGGVAHTGTRRNRRALWATGLLGGLAQSLAGSGGALLVAEVTGSSTWAGSPQAALMAGAAGAAVGLSWLTRVHGRRRALAIGMATAIAGCVLVAFAAVVESLALVVMGSLLIGSGTTATMLTRYAAADLGADNRRGKAMASLLTAITVGAVAGPNLLAPTTELAKLAGWPRLAGPYLGAALAFAAASIVLSRHEWRSMPGNPPLPIVNIMTAATPVPALPLGRRGLAALGVLSLSNLVMVVVMTMAPLQLHHLGSSPTSIGFVVSLHIAGMFAPSPVSGWLTDRIGVPRTAALAGAGLGAACWWAVGAETVAELALAMMVLGIGWNLALLSGSALLTAGVETNQRPHREKWGELGMGLAAGGGVAASGSAMAAGGYPLVAGTGLAIALLVLPVAALTSRQAHQPSTHPPEVGKAPPRTVNS